MRGEIKHCMQLPHNYDGANYLLGADLWGCRLSLCRGWGQEDGGVVSWQI